MSTPPGQLYGQYQKVKVVGEAYGYGGRRSAEKVQREISKEELKAAIPIYNAVNSFNKAANAYYVEGQKEQAGELVSEGLVNTGSSVMIGLVAARAFQSKAAPVTIETQPTILESSGASPRGSTFVSATANTGRAIKTSIYADIGEAQGYKAALTRGEIGLQRPQGANVPGPDFITAYRIRGQMRILVTDVKTSTIGQFPNAANTMPSSWLQAVQAAIGPRRLGLGNPALEAEIQSAFQAGRITFRQLNVDYSPQGQGAIAGWQ
jgi:hypothetical protein